LERLQSRLGSMKQISEVEEKPFTSSLSVQKPAEERDGGERGVTAPRISQPIRGYFICKDDVTVIRFEPLYTTFFISLSIPILLINN
jgi:hypothetical protein